MEIKVTAATSACERMCNSMTKEKEDEQMTRLCSSDSSYDHPAHFRCSSDAHQLTDYKVCVRVQLDENIFLLSTRQQLHV